VQIHTVCEEKFPILHEKMRESVVFIVFAPGPLIPVFLTVTGGIKKEVKKRQIQDR
jgi:hypothetical protein